MKKNDQLKGAVQVFSGHPTGWAPTSYKWSYGAPINGRKYMGFRVSLGLFHPTII